MKRLLFVALALSCFCGIANAQTTRISAAEWSYGNVIPFRSTIQGYATAGTTADTAWATGASARTDTSTAFPLFEIYTPSKVGIASDTTFVNLVIHFDPITTSGITTLAESTIFVLPQVSEDATNWQSALISYSTESSTGNIFNTTGANHVGIVIPPAGTAAYVKPIPIKADAFGNPVYATVSTAPTWKTMWGHRYVRFLVGSAATGKYQLSVDYLTLKK